MHTSWDSKEVDLTLVLFLVATKMMGEKMVIKFSNDIKLGVVHSTLENWIEVQMILISQRNGWT
jgi:hypothetical protein